ncbi:acyl-CoA hydrolase [Thermoflavifilum aggregans]|uniref:Acyl-CoA hydrolase n=1 Tax=Thermoflavifilum aggregans TaxID=454188 RepID=A0A2M9CVV4_9BACT|nr:acetyl-CoA hydrolase/transferase C-terminal domain-containing protein [Thermoflavifilum aggregans]MBX6379428.1 acetyl-CoA hydrolase/transferase family protein [Thermoflavifilum aggregans]PJJ76015.1 acyl-CoA hydrolase [Thermoflavifilum aggregans]
MKWVQAAEAVSVVQSGHRVFIHSVAMTPHVLIDALVARSHELQNVEIVHIHTEGDLPYCKPEYADAFYPNSFFIGSNMRQALAEGIGDYVPVFLSDISTLFRHRILPIDVAFIQVSPPDKHGYCSLGPSVDVTLSAVETARWVVAQVNPRVPRTHGDGIVHEKDIDFAVWHEADIHEVQSAPVTAVEQQIGRHIAALIEDGSTLQTGIGAIPNAVLEQLEHHRDLGIHTEMFSDGLIPLVEKGVITGRYKKVIPNKIVACFVMGSKKVYDFIHDNPILSMKETAFTNDTSIIRKNPKMVAINSAIEIDLTGQVCADSIGTYQYSGVGGQLDFIRGAALSEGGKPIIAMASVTKNGASKIVPFLKPGASVTTTRAHIHYVVTEYGVADLFGKNLRQRAKALIEIAHPDHREWLEKAAYERFKRW